jgi:hypothetical protein
MEVATTRSHFTRCNPEKSTICLLKIIVIGSKLHWFDEKEEVLVGLLALYRVGYSR